ncbi:MAG: hypothetical protein A2W25_03085 [candidate division Zixibacteria bacterium RBG_16_53_22]|nr:MAG: hypothetical protein A2W25_03085 [candidate division Zixibacteria bacterium RBG_16_53_22]
MKIFGYAITAFFLLMVIWPPLVRAQTDSSLTVKVEYKEGTVRIQKPASEGWLTADSGMILFEQDKIRTNKDSRVSLEFLDGRKIRLGSATTLSYSSAQSDDSLPAFTFFPGPGDIWMNVGSQDPGDSMPAAQVFACAAHFRKGSTLIAPTIDSLPAIFRMEIGVDSTMELKVYRGAINVSFEPIESAVDSLDSMKFSENSAPEVQGDILLGERPVMVRSYQKLILTSSGEIVYKGAFAPSDPDELTDWVEWNLSLDKPAR